MKPINLLATGIDVSKIAAQIDANSDLWGAHSARLSTYAHQGLSDIWVRFNDFANFNGDLQEFTKEHESVWYPAYDRLTELAPVIFDIMRGFEGERLGGVLITKIPAGKTCNRHRDTGWHAEYYDKFALQIKAAPGQAFHFDECSLETEAGDLFCFDNSLDHWVTNESEHDRITLIVCIRTRRV